MEAVVVDITDLRFGYRKGGFSIHIPELRIAAGESVVVTGPSGIGKTTLLNLIAGILVAVEGCVKVEGLDMAQLSLEDRQDFRAARMGLVFQEFELLEYLTVLDNVLLPYRISPVLSLDNSVRGRAVALLEDIGLGKMLGRYPLHLSQGERQRTAVCRALVAKPTLLLADEPTGNLDPDNRDHVIRTLIGYQKANDVPLIVVTHQHELIGEFDRSVDLKELST
jgi:putative ABC transport system ATP-binding protein